MITILLVGANSELGRELVRKFMDAPFRDYDVTAIDEVDSPDGPCVPKELTDFITAEGARMKKMNDGVDPSIRFRTRRGSIQTGIANCGALMTIIDAVDIVICIHELKDFDTLRLCVEKLYSPMVGSFAKKPLIVGINPHSMPSGGFNTPSIPEDAELYEFNVSAHPDQFTRLEKGEEIIKSVISHALSRQSIAKV